ncbi:MAG: NAD-dependent epimerase/dehydratase family protein [Pseudomonadota bacterium]
MRVLVTGAGGFIGRALVPRLVDGGHTVRALCRGAVLDGTTYSAGLTPALGDADLETLCGQQQAVVHLAGIAHGDATSAAELLRYNAELTERVFRAAQAAGVERFVYLSSSKVLGDGGERPLPVQAPLNPQDSYAASKATAEERLAAIAPGPTRLLILRPPLVYGPGVRANFARLLWLAALPLPPPLGAATAPRSFISLTNLTQGIECALRAPAGTYHLADPDAWSTAAMAAVLRAATHRGSRLLPLSPGIARGLLTLIGRGDWFTRLFAPSVLETSGSFEQLAFEPAPAAAHAAETMRWYLSQR